LSCSGLKSLLFIQTQKASKQPKQSLRLNILRRKEEEIKVIAVGTTCPNESSQLMNFVDNSTI